MERGSIGIDLCRLVRIERERFGSIMLVMERLGPSKKRLIRKQWNQTRLDGIESGFIDDSSVWFGLNAYVGSD